MTDILYRVIEEILILGAILIAILALRCHTEEVVLVTEVLSCRLMVLLGCVVESKCAVGMVDVTCWIALFI